ncbi:chemotaxis-specific protein-glutamate methyltransferase CheB [Roseomonas sp. KE2513]|uniref:chemotaxis-specific protein-glutamate methyltransferase CheB n=1 Tax=Roseomonas sp. KE2513 TaxID=2479202 RepID=UPI0018E04165|nr:chemotaxis-specific protein-glutamate methyltransferase CheB [Roseomonas sp. KE2513]MBI0537593.1 chemotaxis-specific protein-glutamate methyltransferase CheB [Roseomonas sp. KE2513]
MIRLLVVDDSALMRRLLGSVFSQEPDFEVAFARDGVEALEAIAAQRPDVMTLDVRMPRMDGLACLDRVMLENPLPVVMLSSVTEAGAEATLEALRLGAVDFIGKPAGAASLSIDALAPRLVEKVRAAAGARLRRSHRLAERVRLRTGLAAAQETPARAPRPVLPKAAPLPRAATAPGSPPGLVLVGCSTGGPTALDALLGPLPADFPWPILIAQHMPASFTGPLARRLDGLCALTVEEVTRPVPLQPGHAYVGRGDADLILGTRAGGPVAMAAPSDPDRRWHPSVDRMVDSAMEHIPADRLIGVLMTGMGYDGAAAMARLYAAGGRTIAEAEETAVVWGMPGELVRAGAAGAVLPLESIAPALIGALGQAHEAWR